MNTRTLFVVFALVFALSGFAAAKDPSEWVFRGVGMDEIPAPSERPCRAIRHGDGVNTRLMRNRQGQMVLIASWHTWDHTGYPISGTLSVDDAPPVEVTGHGIGPLFMALIAEEALSARVRAAHTLRWHLPWGEFTADVEGLGAAFDAIDVCPG